MNKAKKILLGILLFTTLSYLLCFLFGPNIMLKSIDKESTESYNYSEYFITDYNLIRSNFNNNYNKLKENYDVELHTYTVNQEEELYIDTMYIKPTITENLVFISTGVHGIEAYIGNVMVEVFINEILKDLDFTNTGVVIVSNVNPYGVKNGRRFNEDNVDLNRNFIIDWNTFDKSINKDYPKVVSLLEPKNKINNYFSNELNFYSKLAINAVTKGVSTVTNALVSGQYEYPNGVYYGGNSDTISTTYLKNVFNRINESNYSNILYFDIHSGYGSRYDMTIFNSGNDPMTEQEAKDAYNYDNIIAHDSEYFYATTGDTTEYFYSVIDNKFLYATCFEFGTLGDGLFDGILSLKYTVEENQNFHYPTTNKTSQNIIDEHYMEMFFPREVKWRENAVDSFQRAMNGVLKYYDVLN